MAKKKLNFEDGMAQLEALVGALENGEMALEDSFAAYEKARALAAELGGLLDAGEARVKALSDNGKDEIDISGEVDK